jgi:hypothetical protein
VLPAGLVALSIYASFGASLEFGREVRKSKLKSEKEAVSLNNFRSKSRDGSLDPVDGPGDVVAEDTDDLYMALVSDIAVGLPGVAGENLICGPSLSDLAEDACRPERCE